MSLCFMNKRGHRSQKRKMYEGGCVFLTGLVIKPSQLSVSNMVYRLVSNFTLCK